MTDKSISNTRNVKSISNTHSLTRSSQLADHCSGNQLLACSNDDPSMSCAQIGMKLIKKLLVQQEKRLREEFAETSQKEKDALKERFELILQNEQVRASQMLFEAHRERKEKIAALQQQLECKNLAALMYVMCAERNKCKMEKLNLIETYTNYINTLNDILSEGQKLILNLSRGYKTAARVDFEWKEKMKKIIDEFLKYIQYSTGTPLDQNQFYFDLPRLSAIESPTVDDPNEDPIQTEPVIVDNEQLQWWEKLVQDDPKKCFIVFGDMGDMKPDVRREVLKTVKVTKTAPEKWKEYAFHEMFLKSDCPIPDYIKGKYLSRLPEEQDKWNCTAYSHPHDRRTTIQSMDLRCNMGSILKIITGGAMGDPSTKANLLGARDSMEIASTTKMRTKSKSFEPVPTTKVVISVGKKASLHGMDDVAEDIHDDSEEDAQSKIYKPEDEVSVTTLTFGKGKNGPTDSLEVIQKHVPDKDHIINYEKVCPMPECQRMHVDSFTRSLPKYMQASPFTHFEQTFDNYETCTPEQIKILKQRLQEKKQHEREKRGPRREPVEPLLEWRNSVQGVAVQTSALNYLYETDDYQPRCTCPPNPTPTPASQMSLSEFVFPVKKFLPTKRKMDRVAKECFLDEGIDFDRFKVVGQDSDYDAKTRKDEDTLRKINEDFSRTRLLEITKILRKNPSLLELFQANT